MLEQVQETILGLTPTQQLREHLAARMPGEAVAITGVAGSLRALLLASLADHGAAPILVVARDRESAERLRDDIGICLGRDAVQLFAGTPARATHEGPRDVQDIQALRALTADRLAVLVTHPAALLTPLPLPTAIAHKSFTIEAASQLSLPDLVTRLQRLGFQKVDFVETYGDVALRGGILDVFPFAGENPIRIEFLGDTVESIREFDPISQRSIRNLTAAMVVPDLLSEETVPNTAGKNRAMLLEYFDARAVVVLDEPALMRSSLEESLAPSGTGQGVLEELEGVLRLFRQVHMLSMPDPRLVELDFGAVPQPAFNGSVRVLRSTIAELLEQDYVLLVTCDSPSEHHRLKELLETIDEEAEDTAEGRSSAPPLDVSRLQFSLEALHEGFIVPASRLAVFTEHQIFNRLKRRGTRRKPRFKGISEKELHQLRRGDFVVHEEYGIGRFERLEKIRVRGVEQEVVKVLYQENDVLYVNLNYIAKLQKYSSKEGHVPTLTKLGSPDWERLKARVKKRVKDIARDLIALYARRRQSEGTTFPKDTPWQKELEASFLYEDTFDQAKATVDVKQDMERPYPMDRLICGDVGFGKTEVAVRAAFKCVMGGKQAAVLVPTTILAAQHYHTFLDRTTRYGVAVEALSRFKSRKEQQLILKKLKAGSIDVIIGTHRLLSRDIGFKDLGLLIIDEEHRFGVAAKEKLRQMRVEVDTLSLTATPIPRTLHFSLLGARDLSVIATPPRNRLPIITEIAQWNDALVREWVERELNRGGQVYVVHDRVQSIAGIIERLQRILPGVRIRSAHGQMHAHELEEVMMEFLERKVDVLVSTKIIESGLDIPNVNTIIVNRADRFGMAELYQLRGRVGRSNTQAYGYLLIPPLSTLPRAALRRLQAMQEFTELGSGFHLAMRDLEIRGAGNLLGAEQSGFIESMGFETYTRILEDAVRELKEDEFKDLFDQKESGGRGPGSTVVEADIDALIPGHYVPSDMERLTLYRRLYTLTTIAQLEEVAEELQDRFGTPPPEVTNLFLVVKIRLTAAKVGFPRVRISAAGIEADFPPESESWFYESARFQNVMGVISSRSVKGVSLRQDGKLLRLSARLEIQSPEATLAQCLSVLETLVQD